MLFIYSQVPSLINDNESAFTCSPCLLFYNFILQLLLTCLLEKVHASVPVLLWASKYMILDVTSNIMFIMLKGHMKSYVVITFVGLLYVTRFKKMQFVH